MEKTTLQKIIEQKADQIRIAIEEAIENGASVKRESSDTVEIDGMRIYYNLNYTNSVVLRFYSEKIKKLFAPSKDDLEKLAEQKRAELADIENQIKEKEAENEADHN